MGGEESIPIDVRIVAASHQNLAERVAAGQFRADLYYRLNGMTLEVPPLRERPEDIAPLADATLERLCLQWNLPNRRLSASFLARLVHHQWAGNVRELQHVIGQALLLEDQRTIEGRHFYPAPVAARRQHGVSPVLDEPSRHQRANAALHAARGNKSLAARSLGVTRRTLYKWLGMADAP